MVKLLNRVIPIYKTYTILDKSETDQYDYTIYGYDGNRDVYIGTKHLKLRDVI